MSRTRKRTDKYPAAVPPVRYIRLRRTMDVPPPIVLDGGETPRERINRLALACSRFVADERERAAATKGSDAP